MSYMKVKLLRHIVVFIMALLFMVSCDGCSSGDALTPEPGIGGPAPGSYLVRKDILSTYPTGSNYTNLETIIYNEEGQVLEQKFDYNPEDTGGEEEPDYGKYEYGAYRAYLYDLEGKMQRETVTCTQFNTMDEGRVYWIEYEYDDEGKLVQAVVKGHDYGEVYNYIDVEYNYVTDEANNTRTTIIRYERLDDSQYGPNCLRDIPYGIISTYDENDRLLKEVATYQESSLLKYVIRDYNEAGDVSDFTFTYVHYDFDIEDVPDDEFSYMYYTDVTNEYTGRVLSRMALYSTSGLEADAYYKPTVEMLYTYEYSDGTILSYTDHDADGDGIPEGHDCDDADADISVGRLMACSDTSEALSCDDIEQNCELIDGDGDGYLTEEGDCDDSDPAVYERASEYCDGKDNDCDGSIDENASDGSIWYADKDGDGFGEPFTSLRACSLPDGYTADYTDCNDDYYSLANECDEPRTYTFYADEDGDGYGSAGNTIMAETQPSGYVTNSSDCDDDDEKIHPDRKDCAAFNIGRLGSTVGGDGVDNDCDGRIDEDSCSFSLNKGPFGFVKMQ